MPGQGAVLGRGRGRHDPSGLMAIDAIWMASGCVPAGRHFRFTKGTDTSCNWVPAALTKRNTNWFWLLGSLHSFPAGGGVEGCAGWESRVTDQGRLLEVQVLVGASAVATVSRSVRSPSSYR